MPIAVFMAVQAGVGQGELQAADVESASLPESWARTWPGGQGYWRYYTMNDQVLADLMDLMFETERV